MNEKEWKRIAEREAKRYREHKAFQKGVEDAHGVVTDRYRRSVRWTLAVEYVLAYLHRVSEEKERFFACIMRRTARGGAPTKKASPRCRFSFIRRPRRCTNGERSSERFW